MPLVNVVIALIVVGVLLYKRRVQSRPAVLTWAIAGLAYLPLQAIIQLKIVGPRMAEVTKQAMPGMDPAFAQTSTAAQAILTALFYAAFPVVLLALMGRKSAKNDLIVVP